MSEGGQLLDQRAEGVGSGQARDLVAELEVVEDVLDVGREAVEISFEVGGELLAAGAGFEIAQGEFRGVVEGLAGGLSQGRVLFNDAGGVESVLHAKDGLLAVFQHCIEAAQHGHRQDDVAVLAAHVEVAQHVVSDAPDVVRNPTQITIARHNLPYPSKGCASEGLSAPICIRLPYELVSLASCSRAGINTRLATLCMDSSRSSASHRKSPSS